MIKEKHKSKGMRPMDSNEGEIDSSNNIKAQKKASIGGIERCG